MASTYQVFEKAEQLELLSAEVYRLLAARFRADPAARAMFERLAAEEAQHASRVRLLRFRYQSDAALFDDAELTSAGLDRLVEEARRLVDQVAGGAWGDNLDLVKQELAELETRFGEAHAHVLARGAHPAVREFFETLARQDEEHRRLLLG